MQRFVFQRCSAAHFARTADNELSGPFVTPAAGRIVIEPGDVFTDTLPAHHTRPAVRGELLHIDFQRFRVAVQDGIDTLFRYVPYGFLQRETVTVPQCGKNGEQHVVGIPAERFDASGLDGLAGVGNHFFPVEYRHLAQAAAMRTSPLRRIEGEGVRCRVVERHSAGRTHEMTAVITRRVPLVIVQGYRPLPLTHRLLQALHQTLPHSVVHHKTVYDEVYVMHLVTVEMHAGRDFPYLSVHTGINVPFFGKSFEQFPVMPLAAGHDRSQQRHFPAGVTVHNQVGYLRVGVVHHLLARHGRIGPCSPCIEQTQKVVDFGHRPHRRAGIFVGGLLLDGHYRTEPRYLVHVGTLHGSDELPRIGRQRFHITPLPLGIDGVECERRLARPGQAGYHHQFPARNIDVYILQIVGPRSEDRYHIVFLHFTALRCARGPFPTAQP